MEGRFVHGVRCLRSQRRESGADTLRGDETGSSEDAGDFFAEPPQYRRNVELPDGVGPGKKQLVGNPFGSARWHHSAAMSIPAVEASAWIRDSEQPPGVHDQPHVRDEGLRHYDGDGALVLGARYNENVRATVRIRRSGGRHSQGAIEQGDHPHVGAPGAPRFPCAEAIRGRRRYLRRPAAVVHRQGGEDRRAEPVEVAGSGRSRSQASGEQLGPPERLPENGDDVVSVRDLPWVGAPAAHLRGLGMVGYVNFPAGVEEPAEATALLFHPPLLLLAGGLRARGVFLPHLEGCPEDGSDASVHPYDCHVLRLSVESTEAVYGADDGLIVAREGTLLEAGDAGVDVADRYQEPSGVPES